MSANESRAAATQVPEKPREKRNKSFTQDSLAYYWFRYAQQMPPEKNYIAGRMRNMNPQLKENWQIEVPVENEMVEQYMLGERTGLLIYLCDNLQNDDITMTFKVSENKGLRVVRTRREMYANMLERSEALVMLREELELELA